MAPQINTNMCLFLLCIILQTGVLVVLFKPTEKIDSAPTSSPLVHELQNLKQGISEIQADLQRSFYNAQRPGDMQLIQPSFSEIINNISHILNATQQFNSQELQALHQAISSITKTTAQNATVTQAAPHIKDTYPELMKYRYALADAESNPGLVGATTMKPDVILLEENGFKYWGWNGKMVEWVYDESGGSGEWLVREVFRKVLARTPTQNPPNLVLDVGSNTGLFSMIAAVYNTKRIYAFDPQPLCVQWVAESAKINGFDKRIAAINAFVGQDETRVAPIPSDTCNGGFKVASKRSSVDIHSVNLDKYFLNDTEEVDLVKVDVEGAELIVLQGAQELFKKHRVRTLVIEITSGWWKEYGFEYETGAALVKETLVDTGYKIWVMPMDKNPPTKLNGWTELDNVMRPPSGYHNQKNYLFSLDDVYEDNLIED